LDKGERKISSDNCEAWFGKNSLPVLFVDALDGKSGDILYKKEDLYQENFSTRRMEISWFFASWLRFRLASYCLYKTIDAIIGCLYSQPLDISRRPAENSHKTKFPNNQNPY
jgi:hypothetical protein